MTGKTWLVRVEGVNFEQTLEDTNDLSTIRGGSLALLKVGDAVKTVLSKNRDLKEIYSGASQCAFTFQCDGDDVVERTRKAIDDVLRPETDTFFDVRDREEEDGRSLLPPKTPVPFSRLTFVVDVVEVNTSDATPIEEALERGEARNHARQFREWTVDPVPYRGNDRNRRADDFDGIRPAIRKITIRSSRVLDDRDERDVDATPMWISESVLARRNFGRRSRQTFYRSELADPVSKTDETPRWQCALGRSPQSGRWRSFSDSFEDICAEPPGATLPGSLETKIAVVYADGNGFAAARAGCRPEGEKSGTEVFAEKLGGLRRRLLRRILGWYSQQGQKEHATAFLVADRGRKTEGLRFETLLWGGDEMAFVMPSWLAVDFVAAFFKETRDWEIGGSPLTHALGVAIGHYKTPIRQLRHIAKEAADLAKDAGLRDRDTVTFEVFESLAAPDVALGIYRAGLFGTATDWDAQGELAAALAFDGDRFPNITERIAGLKGQVGAEQPELTEALRPPRGSDEIPRSQLYAALRAVRAAGCDYRSNSADQIVTTHLEKWAKRVGRNRRSTLESLLLDYREAGDTDTVVGIALDVARVVALWDYVRPLDASWAEFPALEG